MIKYQMGWTVTAVEGSGLIRDRLDIKILILFVLRRLTGAVDLTTLAELCLFDRGIDWFDFSDCLAELAETGHVERTEAGYLITQKGADSGGLIESSIPYTVRREAETLVRPIAAAQKRSAMISASHESQKDGGYMVKLSLSDGVGEIISLRLLASDEEKAAAMEKHFRADAEGFYNRLAEMLTRAD